MTNANTPSVNPANYRTMTGMLREVLGKFLQSTDDMLPARVISFNRSTNLAEVQVMISVITTSGERVSRAPVASVPVMQLGGGGFILDFNLQEGDLGFIKATDRDISLFLQQFVESSPNTYRMHSFEDGIFIPAPMTGYSINSEDAGNCVLQTLDGTQRVSIWTDRVKMTSGESSITIMNEEIIFDTDNATFTGNINGTGVRGTEMSWHGLIYSDDDVLARTVSLHGHVHSGVQSGSSDTGVPVP